MATGTQDRGGQRSFKTLSQLSGQFIGEAL
jgi:hypothetical protein